MPRFYAVFVCLGFAILAACHNADDEEYQGYVEGRFHYMASNHPGILKQLRVARGDAVKPDQILFVLDPLPEKALYEQAAAEVKQAEHSVEQQTANLALAKITYERQQELFQRQATNAQKRDEARSHFEAAAASLANLQANLNAARANLIKATWDKQQKTVASPLEGFVFDTYFQTGEVVPANQPVVSLLARPDIKIVFFIPEKKYSTLRYGQFVQIHCDGCPKELLANISYISATAEYTPPVIYSNDTRDKLVFRVEALPENHNGYIFHPGQPVTVDIVSEKP